MARSGVRRSDVARLRRRLKQLPSFVRGDVADALTDAGVALRSRARAEVPKRSGALAAGLEYKVLAKSLVLKIGLLTAGRRRRLFYGLILDAGRRARTVLAKRRGGKPYRMRIAAISRERYNFVFGRREDFRRDHLPRLRAALERALKRVSGA